MQKEFEQFQTAMSVGTLTMAEFSHERWGEELFNRTLSQVLSRLTGTSDKLTPPLKQCQSCRFWHGKNNVVCAVRPCGYEGDDCTDFEEKP